MIYLADTANIAEIKELVNYFPIAGVTTNPTILSREKKPLSVIVPEIMQCIGDRDIHVQLIAETAEDMLKEAVKYRDCLRLKNFYVKIPVTLEGLKAIPQVKANGIAVTATAIFTQPQALLAACAGADFVAPYVNRLIKNDGNGIGLVADIVKSFYLFDLPTKVLAASFKDAEQVYKVSLTGCQAVTTSYQVLKSLLAHPLTDKSVANFMNDSYPIFAIKSGIRKVLIYQL